MTGCPECDNELTEVDMELYHTYHDGNYVVEEYCCLCPTCGRVFGVNMYYVYNHTEIEEEWE